MLSLWFLKYPVFVSPNVRESKTVLSGGISRAGFQFTGTGIWILYQWNLNSAFQRSVWFRIPWGVFRIPEPRIPDCAAKIFRIPEYGFSYITWFVRVSYIEYICYLDQCLPRSRRQRMVPQTLMIYCAVRCVESMDCDRNSQHQGDSVACPVWVSTQAEETKAESLYERSKLRMARLWKRRRKEKERKWEWQKN